MRVVRYLSRTLSKAAWNPVLSRQIASVTAIRNSSWPPAAFPAKEIVRTAMKGVSVVLVPDDYDSSQIVEEGFESVTENILVAGTSSRDPGA